MFDVVNAIDGPKTYGFNAGTYINGFNAYVGMGDNTQCSNQIPCAGFLTDNPANPGGYFGCDANTVRYRNRGNFYLLNHPNLKWIQTNLTHMMTLPSLIEIGSSSKFSFGRYVVNGVTYLGKFQKTRRLWNFNVFLLIWISLVGFNYINGSNETKIQTGFDILTCGA